MALKIENTLKRARALRRLPGSDSPLELPRMVKDAMAFLLERFERHGPVFKTRFFTPIVFLIGTEANKSIMVTRRTEFSFGRGYGITNANVVFDGSIMLQDGAEHKRTRGMLTPAVGRLAVQSSGEQVYRIWSDAVERMAAADSFDAYQGAEHATFDVAANTITGLDLGPETDSFRPLMHTIIGGMMAPVPYRIPFLSLDRAVKAREAIIDLMRPKIQAARRAEEPPGLVGLLAQYRDEDGTALSDDEIGRHLILLFWAAYDTTASASSWILHTLAYRPDWQERLREELAAVPESDVGLLETNKKLKQLDWFLYELERMYPSALFFPRVAIEDIEYNGHVIPADTPVFYSPYMTHRDPATWDQPNTFDPDRWDPDNDRSAKLSHLVGFGGGPRLCLGRAFAKLQLKIQIYTLLRNHRIEPVPRCVPKVQGVPVHHPTDSYLRLVRL